ncbi:MAG: hypothetical protein WBH00_12775 [Xanthobacteraceae bacterium]
MNNETSTLPGPTTAPDFKHVRKYLKDIAQRERLGAYIKAGWTPAELGEYARTFKLPGKTYPTASAYQSAMEFMPDEAVPKFYLASFREPGSSLPPFNRPNPPPRIPWDHPDNPEHSEETRADIAVIARCLRNRRADWDGLPRPDPDKPIPPSLWKRCYHKRNRRRSLDEALLFDGLKEYR